MSELPSPLLADLAREYGVSTEYWSHAGDLVQVPASTLIDVLTALGVDVTSPERVELALIHRRDDPWRVAVPSFTTVRAGEPAQLPVHVEHGDPVMCWVLLDEAAGGGRLDLKQADVLIDPRTIDGKLVGRATFELPDDLPVGWHEVRAQGPSANGRGVLLVAPARLEMSGLMDQTRAWGLMTQLYSIRSARSWAIGDFADLAEIADVSGHLGADFVLINPVHAAEPVEPMTPSPYLPSSRRFVNPVYIRVEDIRETAYLEPADLSLVQWAGEPARALNEETGQIDRDAAWGAKRAALDVVFAVPRSPSRQTSFERYVTQEGVGLANFAMWCALAERYEGRPWPQEVKTPAGAAVLRAELAQRVTFYSWLQWVADEQLATAQRAARDAGMAIGIMHDLAVGVHPDGADVWSLGSVLCSGARVGAPPDMYNQQGQNWSQPPWHPDELVRVNYQPYRDMIRTALRHAGAIRIDHIIGLFRLWWIPTGHDASDGVYVHYDHDALVGILMLEAERAGAVVIGEDLGTVEPWVRDYLEDRGILGTAVLWFEQENDQPKPPEKWRTLQLATVTTHDLPPSAGYLAGEHVAIRHRLGLLNQPVEQVSAQAARERQQMIQALAARDLIPTAPSEREIIEGMHRYLLAGPSVLIGVSLADAVGERRAQNQPGTDQEYPNWKVPLANSAGALVSVEDLVGNPRLVSLARVLNGA